LPYIYSSILFTAPPNFHVFALKKQSKKFADEEILPTFVSRFGYVI
jgi:hypothetical protein